MKVGAAMVPQGISCNVKKLRYDNADAGHENQRSFKVKQAMSCCFNLPWGELMQTEGCCMQLF